MGKVTYTRPTLVQESEQGVIAAEIQFRFRKVVVAKIKQMYCMGRLCVLVTMRSDRAPVRNDTLSAGY